MIAATPGRDRHRHGQHVVDHQRRAGDEARVLADVLLAHDVGAAAVGVGEDHLPVRDDDDREQHAHDDRDRHELAEPEGEARRAERGDEEDLLGRVRGRRQRVGREHRQRDGLGEPLLLHLGRGERTPDEQSLQRAEHSPTSFPQLVTWALRGASLTVYLSGPDREPGQFVGIGHRHRDARTGRPARPPPPAPRASPRPRDRRAARAGRPRARARPPGARRRRAGNANPTSSQWCSSPSTVPPRSMRGITQLKGRNSSQQSQSPRRSVSSRLHRLEDGRRAARRGRSRRRPGGPGAPPAPRPRGRGGPGGRVPRTSPTSRPDREQDQRRLQVVGAVDPGREVRRGEEEVERQGRRDRRQRAGGAAAEDGDDHHHEHQDRARGWCCRSRRAAGRGAHRPRSARDRRSPGRSRWSRRPRSGAPPVGSGG